MTHRTAHALAHFDEALAHAISGRPKNDIPPIETFPVFIGGNIIGGNIIGGKPSSSENHDMTGCTMGCSTPAQVVLPPT